MKKDSGHGDGIESRILNHSAQTADQAVVVDATALLLIPFGSRGGIHFLKATPYFI